MRPVHRVVVPSGRLCLEPWGMWLTADRELIVEVHALDAPELVQDGDGTTLFAGPGAELRVLRGNDEIYSTFGNPVPSSPPGMSTRDFLAILGLSRGD